MGLETALLVSMAASTAGTAMSAYGSYQSGKNEQKLYEANAANLRLEAEAAKERGAEEATLIKERARKLMAKQIAIAGAGGGDLSGSTLTVMSESAFEAERDVQMALRNANTEARGLRNKANVQDAYGKAARKEGNIRAMTTILQGASNILPMYQSYSQLGGGTSFLNWGTQAGGAPKLTSGQRQTMATISRY